MTRMLIPCLVALLTIAASLASAAAPAPGMLPAPAHRHCPVWPPDGPDPVHCASHLMCPFLDPVCDGLVRIATTGGASAGPRE